MFEKYRAIVIGSRLVKITGKLQSESGVIHVVAEHIEDITGRLSALTAGTFGDNGLANADEVRRPVMDTRNKPKPVQRAAAILNAAKPHGPPPQREPPRTSSPKVVAVMPKGRNFR
jgi:error-prone DNA polymerase